ncbi:MAG: hypothetical protein SFX18_00975 [Pirellulales bacterium]|nr:hypothetical protein [Pirellulales bacterium]
MVKRIKVLRSESAKTPWIVWNAVINCVHSSVQLNDMSPIQRALRHVLTYHNLTCGGGLSHYFDSSYAVDDRELQASLTLVVGKYHADRHAYAVDCNEQYELNPDAGDVYLELMQPVESEVSDTEFANQIEKFAFQHLDEFVEFIEDDDSSTAPA